MNRSQFALLIFLIGLALAALAPAQDLVPGVDLLYPEFAHPKEDANAAIAKRDLRFINVDRHGKVVPGAERYPRLIEIYGTKFIKQPFRVFVSPSQNFSFLLRARAYAGEYNRTLLRYLLEQQRKS
jgi:hypothetical protein